MVTGFRETLFYTWHQW